VSPIAAERGFAIALLLWMIAGMSLTVAAVIHFAREDISLTELRISEARARAAGRGVALMALRDRGIARFSRKGGGYETPTVTNGAESEGDSANVFIKRYQIGDDQPVIATLRPANGYLSLNSATSEQLRLLLGGTQGPAGADGMQALEGILEYRRDYPGFRYPEELLAISGVRRDAYERIRPLVHAYRTGPVVLEYAPKTLAALLAEQPSPGEDAQEARTGSVAHDAYYEHDEMTFEAIAERIRNPGGVTDSSSVLVAEVLLETSIGGSIRQLIWLDSRSGEVAMRMGSLTLVRGESVSP